MTPLLRAKLLPQPTVWVHLKLKAMKLPPKLQSTLEVNVRQYSSSSDISFLLYLPLCPSAHSPPLLKFPLLHTFIPAYSLFCSGFFPGNHNRCSSRRGHHHTAACVRISSHHCGHLHVQETSGKGPQSRCHDQSSDARRDRLICIHWKWLPSVENLP